MTDTSPSSHRPVSGPTSGAVAAAGGTTGQAFGIDIGGTGIKGAVVDTASGQLVTERKRIPTPHPATPDAVAAVVAELVGDAGWTGRIGATFPAVIKHGVAQSAANVDQAWVGTDADAIFTKAVGGSSEVLVLNDADAAGIAEDRFGAAKGIDGVVLMLTFGTGIGSALLINGVLVPNTELGHLELDGHDAESRAAASVRDEHGMSYKKWAKRVNAYMQHVERLFTPDLFIVGGGVSKNADKWVPLLELNTPVKPAQLLNDAGIVGAAIAALENLGE
ncbi:polyphosphate--glucose phosphotransferase [Jatrophihabitans endophyticus]|uniref:polyphosphate--glucose phosphotransferase n=1 Tax=Jatrophihabitans endophyticus TaxID=1206085 RepID=UPI0019E421D5|nr:ROK family protein [Jatrophihabitans endophyticus]MBE7186858.1 ROK family protein [Jatrophihabitans endophyticus]